MLKKIKPQTQYTITNSTNIETSSSSFSIVFYSLLLSVISNSANLRSCSSSLNSPFKSFSLSQMLPNGQLHFNLSILFFFFYFSSLPYSSANYNFNCSPFETANRSTLKEEDPNQTKAKQSLN